MAEIKPLYGNPDREHILSDGSVIRYRRPSRTARTEAHKRALERYAELTANLPDSTEEEPETQPETRTDEDMLLAQGKVLDRGVLLSDALISWTYQGRCVFGSSDEDGPLTEADLAGAPDSMLEEARDVVWRAHVDFEFRHRKN